MPDEFPPPPPPEEVPPPPPEDTHPDAAPAEPQLRRCAKAFSSLLLGIFGCLLGGIALAGLLLNPGEAGSVTITGNLGQMENVLVEDTKTRGIKMFLASFGQWFGAIGALLGLIGITAGITHLYQAGARLVIPQRWLASFGTFFSLIACLSIGAALKHGYDANVGLHVENTKEVFNRLDQVAKIQQKAQDIAEGKTPLQPGGLDEKTMALAESLLGGTLNPITQLGTEDSIGHRAENVEVYTANGNIISLNQARNTRVILMVMSGNSPACANAVSVLNQLRGEFTLGQLLILGVSSEKSAVIEAFAKRTAPRFPVGNTTDNFLPEPYSNAHVKPTFFIIDRRGFIEQILIGQQTIVILRAAARAKP
jgi:peroxiredoxin